MPDRFTLRQERDDDLVSGFVEQARTVHYRYREWIQEEVKDCIIQAEMLEPRLQGTIQSQLRVKMARMRQINEIDFPQACKDLEEKRKEIAQSGSADMLGDRQYIEDCLSKLLGFVHELLIMRQHLDGLEDQ